MIHYQVTALEGYPRPRGKSVMVEAMDPSKMLAPTSMPKTGLVLITLLLVLPNNKVQVTWNYDGYLPMG